MNQLSLYFIKKFHSKLKLNSKIWITRDLTVQFQVKGWQVHLEQGIKCVFKKIPRTIDTYIYSEYITLVTWHNLQRSWRRYFFYRSGKGISSFFFFYWYWSATLIKFLYGTYYKVRGATDTKISSTLYNQKNMKREALARNALNPLNHLSQCTEKKNKMIIVIKIFFLKLIVCIAAFYSLKLELSIGGYYSKGILQYCTNLHPKQCYIW